MRFEPGTLRISNLHPNLTMQIDGCKYNMNHECAKVSIFLAKKGYKCFKVSRLRTYFP